MRRINYFISFSFLIIVLLTISCGTEQTEQKDNMTLEQEHTNLLPYQISHIYAHNGVFSSESYTATFSDSTIILRRIDDSTLVFTTPLIASGDKFLRFKTESDEKILSYTVLQPPFIADNKEYVTNYVNSCIDSINNQLTHLSADTELASFTQYYIQESKKNLSNLTAEELHGLAIFIAANFMNINNSGKSKARAQVIPINEAVSRKYAMQFINDYAILKSYLEDMYTANILKFYFSAMQYVRWFVKTYDSKTKFEISLAIPKQSDIILKYKNDNSSVKSLTNFVPVTTKESTSVIEFSNGKATSLIANSNYRNVNSSDVNSNETAIIQITECYDGFKANVSKANSNILKNKPANDPGNLSKVKEVTGNANIHSNYITISNISNSKVQLVSFDKSEYVLNFKFKTDEITDQYFTFDLNYLNPGYARFTKSFSAKLTVNQPFSIEKVSGDNQTGELGKKLTNPIKVLVKDEAGNPYSGAKVNFKANNGGSVSQAQATTGTDGTASAEWILGSTDAEQTVTVKAFMSDNVTALQGSPLTFIASNEIMSIKIDNIHTTECDTTICETCITDVPAISVNIDGANYVTIGKGGSAVFNVKINNPYVYIWTYPAWGANSVPTIIGSSFIIRAPAYQYRLLRLTRIK